MRKYHFIMGPDMHAALKAYAPKVDMRPSQVLRHAVVEYWRNRGGTHETTALAACGFDADNTAAVFGRLLTDDEKQYVKDYGRGWTEGAVGAGE